ncbi:hypothetical protein J6590_045923 [Homalodisca vitripennis]|nr:hypothetical protein J6590_045923 [Homalodisca vitripennis]
MVPLEFVKKNRPRRDKQIAVSGVQQGAYNEEYTTSRINWPSILDTRVQPAQPGLQDSGAARWRRNDSCSLLALNHTYISDVNEALQNRCSNTDQAFISSSTPNRTQGCNKEVD